MHAVTLVKYVISTCISLMAIFVIVYGVSFGHAALNGSPIVLFAVGCVTFFYCLATGNNLAFRYSCYFPLSHCWHTWRGCKLPF